MDDVYALIDKDTLNRFDISIYDFSKFLYMLNIPIAQYRNKSGSSDEIIQDIEIIKYNFHGKLIINDRLEFANMGDGIHIGQEDLQFIENSTLDPISYLRNKLEPNKWIGLSTHNKDEILKANDLDIDYIGLGAYRQTDTKKDATVSGGELLEIAKLSKHPVAIIGGVKLSDSFDKSIIKYRVIGSDLCIAYLKTTE